MKRRTRRIAPDDGIMITSMVDMFTLILLFLLNFFDPDAQDESLFSLPLSTAVASVDSGLILEVSRAEIKVGDKRVVGLSEGRLPADVVREGQRIEPVFEALLTAHDASAGRPLVVRCDRRTNFALLGDILYTAGAAGWSQYRFVVISEAG